LALSWPCLGRLSVCGRDPVNCDLWCWECISRDFWSNNIIVNNLALEWYRTKQTLLFTTSAPNTIIGLIYGLGDHIPLDFWRFSLNQIRADLARSWFIQWL
jgi:hypothetical protein